VLNAGEFLILAVHEVATSAPFAVTATAGEEPDAYALAHTPTFDALAKGINSPMASWPGTLGHWMGNMPSTVAASE
jgi:hypothetical protein